MQMEAADKIRGDILPEGQIFRGFKEIYFDFIYNDQNKSTYNKVIDAFKFYNLIFLYIGSLNNNKTNSY